MDISIFRVSDLLGIAVGIFFFILFKYMFTKNRTTLRYKVWEYVILVIVIWVLKSLFNIFL
ncbi:hypothetical protein EDM54_11510 [Brevibacillus borstelensis]|jgi:hypothetical protein|uniref:Uncharacterized protein n=1 Tax=Brevibacillus borstelensis AK1 TaxID=1300222 RepID=M8DCK4_9BACL|nr:hypothetical protein I532_18087 [Brevibacillus borstelensis AK1]KKX57090.1 hypothetical protein X546_00760 [Brevibacillus borstelensis cifa_chp40]RNB63153.1 hypothetical protein EDM54_11510 [Brevibacillus borstelensis]GED54185.1 hypothetical protein BBO01nite_34260 [Brevibacillus borstelensis]